MRAIVIYTMREAAQVMKVSPTTVIKLIHDGKLKAYHPDEHNTRWLIPSSAIESYIEDRQSENGYIARRNGGA